MFMGKKNVCIGIVLLVIIFAFRINPDKEKVKASNNFYLKALDDSTVKKIFLTSCYSCHKDSAASLAPSHSVMSLMTARAILTSLTNGKMRQQGANLSEEERKAVAEWITKTKIKSTTFP